MITVKNPLLLPDSDKPCHIYDVLVFSSDVGPLLSMNCLQSDDQMDLLVIQAIIVAPTPAFTTIYNVTHPLNQVAKEGILDPSFS